MRPPTGNRLTVSFTLALLALVSSLALGAAGKLDGKAIFLRSKCNTCHSVPTAGIQRTTKSEKVAGPDLVNVTTDAETLSKFLRRQAEIKGKKHGKAFTGSDEELGALIAWIQAQKK